MSQNGRLCSTTLGIPPEPMSPRGGAAAAAARDRRRLEEAAELAAPGAAAFAIGVVGRLLKTPVVTFSVFDVFDRTWALNWLALHRHCLATNETVVGLDNNDHIMFTSEILKRAGERAREPLWPEWVRRNGGAPSTSGRN